MGVTRFDSRKRGYAASDYDDGTIGMEIQHLYYIQRQVPRELVVSRTNAVLWHLSVLNR